jgi:hypothetical protein
MDIVLVFRVKRRKDLVSTEEVPAWVMCAFSNNVSTT